MTVTSQPEADAPLVQKVTVIFLFLLQNGSVLHPEFVDEDALMYPPL
ncbi:MAG: hypothetical protein HY088_08090 [Ignavibacteriales bacterium]|nr:hypothetical protein [Ignavibacteriales bacterium]